MGGRRRHHDRSGGGAPRAGVARNVLGTESIAPEGRSRRPPRRRVVLSVDLRDGRLISRDPQLAAVSRPRPRPSREP